jgi:hypothetical protein
MAGSLKEPRIITDYHPESVCILPAGFCVDDQPWGTIGQRFEKRRGPVTCRLAPTVPR